MKELLDKIYHARYTFSIHESAHATISTHKTMQGARNALAKFIRSERKHHYEEDGYGQFSGKAWNYHGFEDWDIFEAELKD